MPEIRPLEPHVADLIAAGEVVERPASVVKELAENAIDAGAHSVTVEIQNGGMTLIRVADDGCGIPWDQCETAFLRHATSKLRAADDLAAIGTLGFRGEALAAIAAVSTVELFTRTAEEPLGTSLVLEGGQVLSKEQVGCPLGTTLIVRDLFHNTPARLKFMRRDAAEGAAVFAVVQRRRSPSSSSATGGRSCWPPATGTSARRSMPSSAGTSPWASRPCAAPARA